MLKLFCGGWRRRSVLCGCLLSCFFPLSVGAQDSWSLADSVRRVIEIAPEMKSADARIGQQQGVLEQAIAWPNPTISVQVDETLGLEDASGGLNVTRYSISQALALKRLVPQRRQAEAQLARAKAQRQQQTLLLEYKVAQYFYRVQLTEAELQLAKQRLQQARHYQNSERKGHRGDFLIRYLTPLETMRLDIVLQAAQQAVELAEGEYNEVAASFKALLGMAIARPLRLMPLVPVPKPVGLAVLKASLLGHPALAVDKQMIIAARAGVDVAHAQRQADPVLTLFREAGFYGNRRQNSIGIALSLQLPLLNQNNGRVTQANYALQQAKSELNLSQRDLRTHLNKSYVHLEHLIEQAEHYRSQLLKPAQRVFTLTRKGFDAGELNILTLIDANDTYFDAQGRYLELLQQGWLELTEVRRAAGVFLTRADPIIKDESGAGIDAGTPFGEVK